MTAIKNWFLEKEQIRGFYGKSLNITRETEKAVLVEVKLDSHIASHWVPKSCLIDEWEKDTSNFGYHKYLEDTYHKAYEEKVIENRTIKSGRNTYRGDDFIHQLTTKELQEALTRHGVAFMNRKEWNER